MKPQRPQTGVQGSLSSNLPSSPSEAYAARVCLREAPSRRPLSGPVRHGLGSSWASLAQHLQWPRFYSVERPPGHTGHMREFTRERLGPPPLRPTWGLWLSEGLCSSGSSRVCCPPRGCREALGAPGAEPWQRRGPGHACLVCPVRGPFSGGEAFLVGWLHGDQGSRAVHLGGRVSAAGLQVGSSRCRPAWAFGQEGAHAALTTSAAGMGLPQSAGRLGPPVRLRGEEPKLCPLD